MKKTIKKSLKFILNRPWYIFKSYQDFSRKSKIEVSFIDFASSKKFIFAKKDKLKQFKKMFSKINIDIDHASRFQHWVDEDLYFQNKSSVIGNMPPDYSLIINSGINTLVNEYKKNKNSVNTQNIELLNMVNSYIDRVLIALSENGDNENIQNSIAVFTNMKSKKAANLEEALQRILFWSSMFWQTGHSLVGLGRLDKILSEFANTDKELAKDIIKDFLNKLHEHYNYKSASLKGDIGQIIILGGLEEYEKYFTNELTYIFIDALEEVKVTDPKILLRVSNKTPEDLLKRALQCIQSGIGSPLLSNDDIVIPSLIDFGYDSKDAYNYVKSACWEPVIYGNSLEQNNLAEINYAKVFNNCIDSEKFTECEDLEEFLELYKNEMNVELNNITEKLSSIQWEKEPLFTLFTKNCSITDKNLSSGGAKYNNYGILSVGMANTINSIVNLNELVYVSKKFTTQQIKEIIFSENFEETNLNKLCNDMPECFGKENEMALYIANKILNDISKQLSNYKNPLAGTVKFGLSSPGYITGGDRTKATLDGRTMENL